MTATAVDTRRVEGRRTVSFQSLDDILADVEAMDGHDLEPVGNWTPAQNVAHVAWVIGGSIDGMDIVAPLPVRLFGRLMKRRFLASTFRAGFQLPPSMQPAVPAPDATWDDAVAALRAQVGRVRSGERMTAPSPVFGPMTHEEWIRLHCRHAELHFSFIRVAD